MNIKPRYCLNCQKDVAAVGNFQTGSFVFTILVLLLIFPPLCWIPFLCANSFYEYRCPHCGEKTFKL